MLRYTAIAALILIVFAGCGTDPADPGMEFAPNMFHSIPLEPYSQQEKNPLFKNGLNAQDAPEGTIPRGENWYTPESYAAYNLPNTVAAYDSAATVVKSPIECTEENFERGKYLYGLFCEVCHGKKGLGDGPIGKKEKIGIPSYKTDAIVNLPEGKIFHTLTYGKNLMGSYASQLTPEERWKVVCYVQYLQKN